MVNHVTRDLGARVPNLGENELMRLGLALQETGRIDEAVSCFEQALEIHPDQVKLHYELGLLFAEKHLFELAIEHFDRARLGMPDNAALQASLSLALQNAGLLDRAECSWRTTCSLEPDDGDAGGGMMLN